LTNLIILSLLFTITIIVAFVTTVNQIFKQKKVSEIKSDFINNMTHEFKTPIATIKLAIDAIENVNIENDKLKRSQYLKMIRDENERMNMQVENVLRISQLEKKENIIKKSKCDIHDIINEALVHLDLLLKNREALTDISLEAKSYLTEGSFEDLVNVMVNVLENSIKYSKDVPEIQISSYNEENFIVIKIADKGMGMSNSVKEKIFDKFFRETKGNIHNVKGHGLGLSYVKKIIDLHDGMIYVDSKIGKGTTFLIKLPIII
jgi:two-component system phosphate regulon sensor histidine kinase PhoR